MTPAVSIRAGADEQEAQMNTEVGTPINPTLADPPENPDPPKQDGGTKGERAEPVDTSSNPSPADPEKIPDPPQQESGGKGGDREEKVQPIPEG